MGGFIVLSDGRAWAAANWAYDAAIRYIVEDLPSTPEGLEFGTWLTLQTCEHCGPGLGSVDVRELAPVDRQLFEDAALRAVVSAKANGPGDWNDPSFFPNWLARFQVLAELIGSVQAGEPPESFNPHMTGLIEPTGNRVGPGWDRSV